MSLLKSDQSFSEQLHPISLQYPQVSGRVVLVGGAMRGGIIITWLGAYWIIHIIGTSHTCTYIDHTPPLSIGNTGLHEAPLAGRTEAGGL